MKSLSTKGISLGALGIFISSAIFSSNALAAKTASAGINDFSYTLIDLDTNDGITPEISFTSIYGTASSAMYVSDGTDSSSGTANRSVHSWKNYQTSVSTDDSMSKASSGMFGNSFFAQGELANSYNANLAAEQHFSANFYLSPRTKLLMSGTMAGSVLSSGYGYNWMNNASSNTSIQLSNVSGTNRVSSSGQANLQYSNGDDEQYFESDFSLSYVNRSSNSSYGLFEVHNTISAQDYGNSQVGVPPAVPEPETYAMLLSGLAVVGMLARRRAAKKIV